MTRAIPEWIATHDDQAIPTRVKIRVFDLFNGKCQICELPVTTAAYDHRVALINGGAHRESNLQLLCVPCHKGKTKSDVAKKSKTARVRARHLGIKKPSRFPGSKKSKFKKKVNGEVILR
jgi:5-methylcytosine-specific restriction endonuclease McrA